MTFKASSYQAISPGMYDATLLDIEDGESEYGEFRKWIFDVVTPQGARNLTAVTSANSGPRSKAYRWATALLGRRPGDEAEDLTGRRCQLTIIVNDDGFNRIDAVLPPRTPDADALNLEPAAPGIPF